MPCKTANWTQVQSGKSIFFLKVKLIKMHTEQKQQQKKKHPTVEHGISERNE